MRDYEQKLVAMAQDLRDQGYTIDQVSRRLQITKHLIAKRTVEGRVSQELREALQLGMRAYIWFQNGLTWDEAGRLVGVRDAQDAARRWADRAGHMAWPPPRVRRPKVMPVIPAKEAA